MTRSRALRELLEFLADAPTALSVGTFRVALPERIASVVPADLVVRNEFDPAGLRASGSTSRRAGLTTSCELRSNAAAE
jgi:hypothetical protein